MEGMVLKMVLLSNMIMVNPHLNLEIRERGYECVVPEVIYGYIGEIPFKKLGEKNYM